MYNTSHPLEQKTIGTKDDTSNRMASMAKKINGKLQLRITFIIEIINLRYIIRVF